MEADISTLSTAGIHFDPKVGSQLKFMFIPEQPGARCDFLSKGKIRGRGA